MCTPDPLTVSNDTRVRMEGLVKIMAMLLPAQQAQQAQQRRPWLGGLMGRARARQRRKCMVAAGEEVQSADERAPALTSPCRRADAFPAAGSPSAQAMPLCSCHCAAMHGAMRGAAAAPATSELKQQQPAGPPANGLKLLSPLFSRAFTSTAVSSMATAQRNSTCSRSQLQLLGCSIRQAALQHLRLQGRAPGPQAQPRSPGPPPTARRRVPPACSAAPAPLTQLLP